MVEDVGVMQEFCEAVKQQFGELLKAHGGVEQFLQNVLISSRQAVAFFTWLLQTWPTNAGVLYSTNASLPVSDHRDLAQASCCLCCVLVLWCCVSWAGHGLGSARGRFGMG